MSWFQRIRNLGKAGLSFSPHRTEASSSSTAAWGMVVTTTACATMWLIQDESKNRLSTTSPCFCDAPTKKKKDGNKLVFLGTGSSTGCPVGVCAFTLDRPFRDTASASLAGHHIATPKCNVSHLALQGDPKYNKNYRNNPSFLIQYHDEGRCKNVVIDVGKTFREGAMRWFPEFQVQSLDAIILTHEHMDAAAGLDDVRGFQPFLARPALEPNTPVPPPKRIPVPLFLSEHCHDILSRQFPFLLPKQRKEQTSTMSTQKNFFSQKPVIQRDVAGFQVNIFESYQPEQVAGLSVIPLPVWHGDDLISYGFAFSVPTEEGEPVNVVYLSDISRMVPETMEFIQKQLPPTDILIVDALLWKRKHPTHYSLEQAAELRDQIQPRMQTYLVGMSCEDYLPHEEMEIHLKARYGNITMAHDGLCISL